MSYPKYYSTLNAKVEQVFSFTVHKINPLECSEGPYTVLSTFSGEAAREEIRAFVARHWDMERIDRVEINPVNIDFDFVTDSDLWEIGD